MSDIYYSIEEHKNCLSCAFFKIEDIWYSCYCDITGLTLDDYLDNDDYTVCDDYFSENT